MIPYHFHLIWMGQKFPYVNVLAVESILKTNPNCKLTIHYSDPPLNNANWEALKAKVAFINFKAIDFEKGLNDLPLNAAQKEKLSSIFENVSKNYPAGKSNILRYMILYSEGGIYIDFDTLTLKSFEPLLNNHAFIGEETVFKCDDDRVSGKAGLSLIPYGAAFGTSYYGSYLNSRFLADSKLGNYIHQSFLKFWGVDKLNNAVLGSEAAHPFYKQAIENILDSDPAIKYNLGPMLMNRIWDNYTRQDMTRYKTEYFYYIPPSQTFRFFYGPPFREPENMYCIHWCSSNHKKLAAQINSDSICQGDVRSNPFGYYGFKANALGIINRESY